MTALNTSGTESARSEIVTTTVPMTALPAGTYEDGSPSVTQQGDWTKASSTYDSGGSVSSLTGTGYAEMSFATSGIRWVTRTNAYSGIADVWIDGASSAPSTSTRPPPRPARPSSRSRA